jgi:hypothetical protein
MFAVRELFVADGVLDTSGTPLVGRICGSVLRPDRSTPDSCNHPQQLPAGIGSNETLSLQTEKTDRCRQPVRRQSS